MLVCCALLVAATTISAAPSLLVTDVRSRGLADQPSLNRLCDHVREAAASCEGYAVIPASEASHRLHAWHGDIPWNCPNACAADWAERLDADFLLLSSLEREAGGLRFRLQLTARNGRTVAQSAVPVGERADLAVREALRQVLEVPTAVTPWWPWLLTGVTAVAGVAAVLWNAPEAPAEPPTLVHADPVHF